MKELIYINEPKIMFGFGQKLEDPRDGLTLFGPIENNKPYGIMNGVVGTKQGLAKFKAYVDSIAKPIFNANSISRPFFPGFDTVFRTKWSSEKIVFNEIKNSEIEKYLYIEDTHTRTYGLVSLFAEKIIKTVEDEDAKADVWFVIIPDEIYQYCRPKSSLPRELVVTKKKITKHAAMKELHFRACQFIS